MTSGDLLNTREAALLVWASAALGYCIYKAKIREALWALLKHAVRARKLLVFFGVMLAYMALVIASLSAIGLWNPGQWKGTFLWLLFVAPVAAFPVVTKSEEPSLWRRWVADHLKLIVLVEFIVDFYTAPFLVELLFIPFATVLTALIATGERQKDTGPAVTFLNGIMTVFGLGLLVYAAFQLATDWHAVADAGTVQDISLAPLLSLGLMPFLYGAYVYSAYERAFIPLKITMKDDKALRSFTRSRAVLHFGLRTGLLKRWSRELWRAKPKTRNEVVRSIRAIFKARAREMAPPPVPAARGWCPYKATGFLAKGGITTEDYHEGYGEWFAQSHATDLGRGLFPDYVIYSVNGDEEAATELRLRLHANNPEDAEAVDRKFAALAHMLVAAAASGLADKIDLDTILLGNGVEIDSPEGLLVFERKAWSSGDLRGEERVLRLRRGFAVTKTA